MVDFTEQRKYMIEGHLRPCGVRDSVILRIVQQVPRENFLPANLKSLAYLDDDIKLDNKHFLLRPNDLLRMILALRISPADKVLDIGCTTGYSTIIMSFLANQVVGLEEQHDFVSEARAMASLEGTMNTSFVAGSYDLGFAEAGLYDAILLQRAYNDVPQAIIDQLAEAGRLVYIKQSSESYGQAFLLEKHHGRISQKALFELCVPFFQQDKTGFAFQ
jgi:protein-L-isoaspartate(D-aspartate) O-methyltransferase